MAGIGTFVRCFASVTDDTPLADRWDALGEAIAEHGRELDRIQTQHRLDMIARYGLPDDHFTKGPAR